jgi:hypothetical protein
VSLAADAAPSTNARLTTILPDKYPGEEIVFTAIVATVRPSLTVTRVSRWPISATLEATRTFSYVASRRYEREAIAAAVRVGLPF